jgi:hypothetical protein
MGKYICCPKCGSKTAIRIFEAPGYCHDDFFCGKCNIKFHAQKDMRYERKNSKTAG